MKKIICLSCMLIAVLVISGCSKSPKDKLENDKLYPDLAKIWPAEHAKNSKLWQEATVYCKTRWGWFGYKSEKPNCKAVMEEVAPTKITGKLNSHPINDTFDFKK